MNKEVNGVLSASEEKQYEYFIKKVVDYEEVWGLYGNDCLIIRKDNGIKIPLWPKEEFIKENIKKEFREYTAKTIDVNDFIDLWIPKIIEKKIDIALFWDDEKYISINVNEFKIDLENEMDNY